MKLIYASALPLALALPHLSPTGKDDNEHPCEGRLRSWEDQAECMKALYEEFGDLMKGEFSKPMKNKIQHLAKKVISTPSTPSTPSTSSTTSSGSTGSSGSTPSTLSTLSTGSTISTPSTPSTPSTLTTGA